MSVAVVKVAWLTALVVVLATAAKCQEHEEYYSEFIDDAPALRPRRSEELEPPPNKKKIYDKEELWNEEDFEIEEETSPIDEQPKEIKVRKVRQVTYETFNGRPNKYDVFEIVDHDGILPAESRPEKLYFNGHHYQVIAPQPVVASSPSNHRPRSPSGHYHDRHGSPGSPPASRYVQDSRSAASDEGKKSHSSSHGSRASSADHHAKHHSEHGGKGDKGYKSAHHHEKGAKGSEGHEKHAKSYNEHGGKKKADFDQGGYGGEHHQAAHGSKGGNFEDKKAHDKGHNTKGYHNKYQKDEYHKEHKFYDDHHRSGSHSRFGDFHSKHGNKEGGSKKGDHHDAAHHEDHRAKKGQHASGHSGGDHKGHKAQSGHDSHYAHHTDYGKKGGNQGGGSYGYHTKH